MREYYFLGGPADDERLPVSWPPTPVWRIPRRPPAPGFDGPREPSEALMVEVDVYERQVIRTDPLDHQHPDQYVYYRHESMRGDLAGDTALSRAFWSWARLLEDEE